jgi:hypothetical protein
MVFCFVLFCFSAKITLLHTFTYTYILYRPSLSSFAVMESDTGVVLVREITGSILRRSIEQLHNATNRLLTRCTETQETNTCEKPLSQTHVLIAVIVATGYDFSSPLHSVLSTDANLLTLIAHISAYYSSALYS